MLERQINEMAREHAREKQDLVNRIEEIRSENKFKLYSRGVNPFLTQTARRPKY